MNDKTPPPSLPQHMIAAKCQHGQREWNVAKETADEHARLAAEVVQLKPQLEKEKKRKQSQSVADPSPKQAKPSAAASKKKLISLFCFFSLNLFLVFTIFLLSVCAQTNFLPEGRSLPDALMATLAADQSVMRKVQSRAVSRAIILLGVCSSSSLHRAQVGHCTEYSGCSWSWRNNHSRTVQRTEDGFSERRLSFAATNSAHTKQDCKAASQHDPRTHCAPFRGDQ